MSSVCAHLLFLSENILLAVGGSTANVCQEAIIAGLNRPGPPGEIIVADPWSSSSIGERSFSVDKDRGGRDYGDKTLFKSGSRDSLGGRTAGKLPHLGRRRTSRRQELGRTSSV